MTVPAEEFIRRLLQHVLPKGFQKVRHFGFMHKRSKISQVWLAMLVTVTLNMVYVLVVNPPGLPAKRPMRCPDCGGELKPDVRKSDFSEALPCAINDDIPTVDQFKLPRGFMNRGINVG